MLEIDDLSPWLPRDALELFQKNGIKELYPPQAQAIERGLMDGRNMMLSIPTAAGKTLLAELAMLRASLAGKRCLYIVPLRALASEKYESFRRFRRLGLSVGISTGDFDRRDEFLGRNQIIVATSEKADSLIRNGASWISELGVVVADEVHLLNDPGRGPTLEMTLTKLRKLNPNMQVIALSATVANGLQLASWLHAEYVLSQWRPILLREGIILRGRLTFADGQYDIKKCGDDLLSLVKDTMEQGAQILIFESSRKNAEATAIKLAGILEGECPELAEAVLATGESETARRLSRCLAHRTAFHHAGLLAEQRKLVEEGFRRNQVRVIASTPTLAAGLNLPARRVLIRSYKRYEAGRGMVPIPVIEYRQMAGRAGRPGLDPYGESLLMARGEGELRQLMEAYVLGQPEEISSKLASESALRTHLLSTIATGFASSFQELSQFLGSTFFAHQQDPWVLDASMKGILEFLVESQMLDGPATERGDLLPTRLGSLVSRLYIDPYSAWIIINNLRQRPRPTEVTLIHLITMTPNMETLYINQADGWVEEFIDRNSQELNDELNYDFLLRQAKTTSMLLDWIGEVREDEIGLRYRIGPGDVRRVAETAEWLMHATHHISRHLDLGATFLAERLFQRIHYGAGPELLELLELKGIGRVRARKLYQAGVTNISSLREVEDGKLKAILGPSLAEKVRAQLSRNGAITGPHAPASGESLNGSQKEAD